METLQKKLHSQRGASILLALLFLLACMMVAASVLMAAVSNAGKIRSNYDEQQRYLALSSALRLVAEELEQAKYRGRYTVKEWTEVLTVTETDADGNAVTTEYPYHYYSIEQRGGSFSCEVLAPLVLDSDGNPVDGPNTVLTFRKELDGAFAGEFSGTGHHPLTGDDSTAPLPTNPPGCSDDPKDPSRTTRILTVRVQGDDRVKEMFHPVTVVIDMSQSRRVRLKATLPSKVMADGTPDPAGSQYIMEAELEARLMEEDPDSGAVKPAGSGMPALNYLPGDRMPKDEPLGEGDTIVTESGTLSLKGEIETKTCTTEQFVTWRLDWISREIKEEANG